MRRFRTTSSLAVESFEPRDVPAADLVSPMATMRTVESVPVLTRPYIEQDNLLPHIEQDRKAVDLQNAIVHFWANQKTEPAALLPYLEQERR